MSGGDRGCDAGFEPVRAGESSGSGADVSDWVHMMDCGRHGKGTGARVRAQCDSPTIRCIAVSLSRRRNASQRP